MKRNNCILLILPLLLLSACVGGGNFDDDGYRILAFKDQAFKNELLAQSIDLNGDGEISVFEMARATAIRCDDKGLKDVKELRFAADAQRLYFQGNSLTGELDLSRSQSLIEIDFSNNPSLKKITLHYQYKDSETLILNPDQTSAAIEYTKDDSEEE